MTNAMMVNKFPRIPRVENTMAQRAPTMEVASLNNNWVPSSEVGLEPNPIVLCLQLVDRFVQSNMFTFTAQ